MKPKTFLKRGAGLLTAGIMALTAFTGCSGDQGTGLFIDGKHQDIDWVMKINGEEVSMDLYRCYYLNQVQSDVNSYGDDYWNNEELYNQTKVIAESNVECYTEILRQCRERGITLDADEQAQVDAYMQQARSNYETDGDWQAALEVTYFTEDLLRQMQEFTLLQQKLMEQVCPVSEEEVAAARETVETSYYKAQHILLLYPDDYDTSSLSTTAENPITDADTSSLVYQQMLDIQQQLENGADFTQLEEEYSEDANTVQNYLDGLVFTDGEMVQQFEDTVKSLDLNEVSGIIKTSYGYHIVKRVPLTEEDIQETAQSLAAQQADQSDTFADWVYDQVDAANVEYCDQYDLITPDTMK